MYGVRVCVAAKVRMIPIPILYCHRCVRTINSVKVFVEAHVSCNDAYSCAIPRVIVEVVGKYFKSLCVVIAKYKISMCVSARVPSFMS